MTSSLTHLCLPTASSRTPWQGISTTRLTSQQPSGVCLQGPWTKYLAKPRANTLRWCGRRGDWNLEDILLIYSTTLHSDIIKTVRIESSEPYYLCNFQILLSVAFIVSTFLSLSFLVVFSAQCWSSTLRAPLVLGPPKKTVRAIHAWLKWSDCYSFRFKKYQEGAEDTLSILEYMPGSWINICMVNTTNFQGRGSLQVDVCSQIHKRET